MPMRQRAQSPTPPRRAGGFRHAARLVEDRVRRAGEARGFAAARLLTHWDEIVGPEAAALARPLKLSWARGKRARGLGATLTLAVPGAAAPMVQMLVPRIRERVNASLGFAAVARIALAPDAAAPQPPRGADGFAEPAVGFDPAPSGPAADPQLQARAAAVAEGVQDPALRAALESLARNVLTRRNAQEGPP